MAKSWLVEGEINIEFYNPIGKIRETQKYPFSFTKSDSTWHVSAVQPNGLVLSVFYRDGATPAIAGRLTDYPVVPVRMHGSDYPIASYFEQVPWFAFGGLSVLLSNRFIPAPWATPQIGPEAHIYRIEFQHKGAFISEAKFIQDKERLRKASNSELIHRETRQGNSKVFAPLGEPGVLGGVYNVLVTTNVGGIDFPASFSLENYRSDQTPNSPGHLARRFRGIVTNIVIGDVSITIPTNLNYGITDFRYSKSSRGVDSVSYQTTNLFEPFPNPVRQKMLKEKLGKSPWVVSHFAKRHAVVCAIVFFTILFLTCFYFGHFRKKV